MALKRGGMRFGGLASDTELGLRSGFAPNKTDGEEAAGR